jgi:23S rRNA pseudouridine2605 synthase
MDKRQKPDANRSGGKRFTKGPDQGREGGDRSSQRKSSFNKDQGSSFKSSREGSHEREERKSFPSKRFSSTNDGGGERSKDGIYAPKEYKSMRREGGSYRPKDDNRAPGSDRPNREDRPRREGGDFKSQERGSFNRGGSSDRPRSEGGDYKPQERGSFNRGGSSDRPRSEGGDYKPQERGSFNRSESSDRPRREGGDYKSQERGSFNRGGSSERPRREGDSRYPNREGQGNRAGSHSFNRDSDSRPFAKREGSDHNTFGSPIRKFDSKPSSSKANPKGDRSAEGMRLNRFLAHAGICSRREADVFIKAGLVKVNNKVVTEMGYIVGQMDEVRYNDSIIKSEKKVYLLLNKPKGFITTSDDPKARKTVMDLIAGACKERVYPVGRLDRATTGVLLFTNDGDMTDKLLHPSKGAQKIYEVVLDKVLSRGDLQKIADGITLEDGIAQVDGISYVDDKDKKHIGIEIHIGKNRIVRRIFESLGYEVTKLDRVFFAGLTKKRLERGHWRFLTEKEVNFLRMR